MSLLVASATAQHTAAPSVPRIGPARPTRASARAFSPSDLAVMNAPRNGTNIGALAFRPSRRSWITWPTSWMNRRITKPAANDQPHSSE